MRVGFVTTYARWKGHLTLLDAAAALARAEPDLPVRWDVVGVPIYATAAQFTEADPRAAAAVRGLAGRVGFVPFRPDPAGVYNALDVVVHASTLPEPCGLTVAEAMAGGRCWCRRPEGAAELFADGHYAEGVAPGDSSGLAAAVSGLVRDRELRARLGAAARLTADVKFADKAERRRARRLLQARGEVTWPVSDSDAV